MKLFAIPLLFLASVSFTGWENDFEVAKQKAQDQHKQILLVFSGSDWCGPCILFKKQVLESPEFVSYADTSLVLLSADFPRLKKNQLSKEQQQKNDRLAGMYNNKGFFPMVVLMDAEGKTLKAWEGSPGTDVSAFIGQLKAVRNAGN